MPDLTFYQLLFYSFSFVAVLSAGVVLFTKNVFYAALSLVLSLLAIAGIFVFAYADFLAVTQIMVYVGAVLILLAFGLMISKREDNQMDSSSHSVFSALLICTSLFYLLFNLIEESGFVKSTPSLSAASYMKDGSLQKIGMSLLTDYVLAFEFAGLVLLLALIAATYIAARAKFKL